MDEEMVEEYLVEPNIGSDVLEVHVSDSYYKEQEEYTMDEEYLDHSSDEEEENFVH